MSEQEHAKEFHGVDVESAVAAGLAALGLSQKDVTIEVVDEGRRGFLGLGGREAVVRLTPIKPAPARPAPVQPTPAGAPIVPPVTAAPPAADSPEPTPPTPEPVSETVDVAEAAPVESSEAAHPAGEAPATPAAAEEMDETVTVTVQIVEELIARMGLNATVEVKHSEPDDLTGRELLVLNVVGPDAHMLIGARGETMNDLQYIARLMAGHALHQRADFLIDVEGYRDRRQNALAQLAQRMARKAVKRGQAVTLEPMSPYDRRIIHMALRNDDRVTTQSTGEGSRRRVRIYPK